MSELTDAGVASGAGATGLSAASGVHSLIWVRGRDAVSFLDVLISQSIAGSQPGSVRRSLWLTPQGKMRALLWVMRSTDEEVGLITQATTATNLVTDLTRFRFRVEADIETDPRPVTTLAGSGNQDVLRSAGLPDPAGGWVATANGVVAACRFPRSDVERLVLVGEAAAVVDVAADPAGYESIRVAAGEPVGEVDFDDSTISHELGPVDDAVDFTKGCYLGQELVARIDSRGRVTKRLMAVTTEQLVDLAGATVTSGDRSVGTVTSSAPNPIAPGTIGLSLVHHEVEAGTEVMAGQLPVEIAEVPILGT